jgi:hypothetical protein
MTEVFPYRPASKVVHADFGIAALSNQNLQSLLVIYGNMRAIKSEYVCIIKNPRFCGKLSCSSSSSHLWSERKVDYPARSCKWKFTLCDSNRDASSC